MVSELAVRVHQTDHCSAQIDNHWRLLNPCYQSAAIFGFDSAGYMGFVEDCGYRCHECQSCLSVLAYIVTVIV